MCQRGRDRVLASSPPRLLVSLLPSVSRGRDGEKKDTRGDDGPRAPLPRESASVTPPRRSSIGCCSEDSRLYPLPPHPGGPPSFSACPETAFYVNLHVKTWPTLALGEFREIKRSEEVEFARQRGHTSVCAPRSSFQLPRKGQKLPPLEVKWRHVANDYSTTERDAAPLSYR
jgi:hypothetical protein